ncbi:MAG TPA: caspase family protein [Blastocatellia bacterium]|nr:caspase family protein [Blastocatellia bacterium]
MLRLHRLVLVLVALASLYVALSPAGSSAAEETSLRAPFVLELPDIGARIEAPEAVIPPSDVRQIRFVVRRPFADAIDYGKIHTTINGESAGTIQEKRSGREGIIIVCNLEAKPHLFRLRPGKNVVEISATDRDRRLYYASFVLLVGGQLSGDAARAAGATIESLPAATGSDRQPPTIYLIEPKSSVRAAGNAAGVRIYGVVSDDSGKVASVTINGVAAPLSPAAATRGLVVRPAAPVSGELAFDRTVPIPADQAAIIIEARDAAGNTARLLLPIRRREAAVSSKFSGRKFALIIGVSRYQNHDGGLNNLGYADADARAIRDFLQRREGGGFASADIAYLENEQATLGAVRAALVSFLPKAGPNDLLFVFLAGHGSPDPYAPQNLYFLLHDTKVADMPNTALPMEELKDVLDHNTHAERIVVFVDTCHSAGLSGQKMVQTRGLENNLINLYAQKLYKETGRALLTSSDINELSQESEQWGGHGIFTLALLEGFRGDADANGDHLVTAGELFNYVRDRVRVATAFQQNPRALPGLSTDLALAVAMK